MKRLLLASTSTIHGSDYLDYLLEEISKLFISRVNILFIPYARPGGISHDDYTKNAAKVFSKIGKKLTGVHAYQNPIEAVAKTEGIFTGGGNTFVLLSQLYKQQLLEPLKNAINSGTPYLGTSAGSNVCGLTIHTTNDMPIVYPPSFKAMGLIPFNINPHYKDPDLNSTHKGETRETRIKEFHAFNPAPVVGLREGSWLDINATSVILKGNLKARIFERQKTPYEVEAGIDLKHLN